MNLHQSSRLECRHCLSALQPPFLMTQMKNSFLLQKVLDDHVTKIMQAEVIISHQTNINLIIKFKILYQVQITIQNIVDDTHDIFFHTSTM